MATLSTQGFTQLLRNSVTAIQSASSTLLDLTIGSCLRAIVEASSGVAMWLQAFALQIMSTTRLATSSGSDVDSFIADYGLTRLSGNAATGTVTFTRFTATQQGLVPVGATVQTTDGTQDYTVTVDTTNAAYSATLNGYVLNAGITTVNVPVQCQAVGQGGNAVIGAISVITSAIPGIDTVSNGAAFTNGADPETDDAVRIRFQDYIAGLSKGTRTAIGYAIESVKQGITYSIVENQDYSGNTDIGYFYVVIDDGTGSPGTQVINDVAAAIDAVRAFTVTFGVFGPNVITANVNMTVTVASGYDPTAVKALVTTSVTDYINTLPLGTTLPYTRLAQVAYGASDGVSNITSVLLNGGTSDLSATAKDVIKSGTITIS